MRAETEIISTVRKAVLEIKNFYDKCECTSNKMICLNQTMLSFALGLATASELCPILALLLRDGYVANAEGNCVVFSERFLNTAA